MINCQHGHAQVWEPQCLSVQPIQPKMLRKGSGHDFANSCAAFRLQGAVESLRQLQKPSSSVGNDAGSGRSGITPTYQKYHSGQLKSSAKPYVRIVFLKFFVFFFRQGTNCLPCLCRYVQEFHSVLRSQLSQIHQIIQKPTESS